MHVFLLLLIVTLPLSQIPEEMNRCRNSYVEQALLPQRLEELAGEEAGQGGSGAYLQDSLDTLLKEAKDKFRGYDSCSTPEHAELAYRKVSPKDTFFKKENYGIKERFITKRGKKHISQSVFSM